MFDKSMLITAIHYEAGKRETLARLNMACDRTVSKIEAWVDDYDKKHYRSTPCLGNIMCERTGARHRKDCIGKVEPIEVFWKKVQTNG